MKSTIKKYRNKCKFNRCTEKDPEKPPSCKKRNIKMVAAFLCALITIVTYSTIKNGGEASFNLVNIDTDEIVIFYFEIKE